MACIPQTASTRRAALGAILAAPPASAPAVAADPHVARQAKALALYRRHRETEWGWGEPRFCPACREASKAHADLMIYANEASDMPPTTLAGLGAFALSIALAEDQAFTSPSLDGSERNYVALSEGVLAVTGTTSPPDYRGLVHYPEEDQQCG